MRPPPIPRPFWAWSDQPSSALASCQPRQMGTRTREDSFSESTLWPCDKHLDPILAGNVAIPRVRQCLSVIRTLACTVLLLTLGDFSSLLRTVSFVESISGSHFCGPVSGMAGEGERVGAQPQIFCAPFWAVPARKRRAGDTLIDVHTHHTTLTLQSPLTLTSNSPDFLMGWAGGGKTYPAGPPVRPFCPVVVQSHSFRQPERPYIPQKFAYLKEGNLRNATFVGSHLMPRKGLQDGGSATMYILGVLYNVHRPWLFIVKRDRERRSGKMSICRQPKTLDPSPFIYLTCDLGEGDTV